MVKKFAMIACAFLLGCTSTPKYVEGTNLSLGAYIPWNGSMYGVELMNYVNGIVVKVPTNICYEIEHRHSATNDWCWGMLKTVECSGTTVRMK